MIFLTPLYQAALKIGLLNEQIIHLDILHKDMIYEQSVHKIVSLVEIYRTYHRLEGVAIDMFLREVIRRVGNHIIIQTDTFCHLVECLSRHHFRTQLCQKPLIFVGKLNKKILRRNTLNHGISQILQTLIIDVRSILQHHRCRLMYEC